MLVSFVDVEWNNLFSMCYFGVMRCAVKTNLKLADFVFTQWISLHHSWVVKFAAIHSVQGMPTHIKSFWCCHSKKSLLVVIFILFMWRSSYLKHFWWKFPTSGDSWCKAVEPQNWALKVPATDGIDTPTNSFFHN